ncbi:MAG: hypothetical protein ACD_79C01302G0011 [uncultured bacterium]|nr:MAG: hypothetical protein ACD_79C01302G0011 [uncultured bacterium]
MRKIAVITGTRADLGLLKPVIKKISENKNLSLKLIVTGSHLSKKYGYTVREIIDAGFKITKKVPLNLDSDSALSISKIVGDAVSKFGIVYNKLKPDIILVLGDRYEIFAAVAAAVSFRIPIAHVRGGESTEGAFDESFRHAITKMSHIHFAANKYYAYRIIQMGEMSKRVFCVGDPGLDNIVTYNLLTKKELAEILNIPQDIPWGILTYHPVTFEHGSFRQIRKILNVVQKIKDIFWIMTYPNADTENKPIIKALKEYNIRNKSNSILVQSLGSLKYLSLLKHAKIMVGNSSSGLVEAPSFKLPVVNIGERQKGRICAGNVINVKDDSESKIKNAIEKALSKKFKNSLKKIRNPYGNGNASTKIVKILNTIQLEKDFLKKKFNDVHPFKERGYKIC